MASTVGNNALRTHANGLRDRLDGVSPKPARVRSAAKTAEIRPESRKGGSLVREAMRTADLSQKAFALDASQTESTVSEGLSGGRNLAFDWILNQTDLGFRVSFIEALQRAWDLDPKQDHQVQIDLAVALFDRLVSAIESSKK